MKQGELLKEAGIARVEKNNPDWVAWARYKMLKYGKDGRQVTADDLRRFCIEEDMWPKHSNAFGAVFKGGNWASVGFTKSTHPSNHARVIRIWVRKKT